MTFTLFFRTCGLITKSSGLKVLLIHALLRASIVTLVMILCNDDIVQWTDFENGTHKKIHVALEHNR
jgi:hypothetical protein